MAKKSSSGGLVYSTEFGRACPGCQQPVDQCCCSTDEPHKAMALCASVVKAKVGVGKVMTLVTGVPLTGAELKTLAKELKKKCGVGGALKYGVIEIQGDQRDLLLAELTKRGFAAKKAGG